VCRPITRLSKVSREPTRSRAGEAVLMPEELVTAAWSRSQKRALRIRRRHLAVSKLPDHPDTGPGYEVGEDDARHHGCLHHWAGRAGWNGSTSGFESR